MAEIWEFSNYTTNELFKIRDACDLLHDFGIRQNNDMLRELMIEIEKRGA